jgi:hypothetical protein
MEAVQASAKKEVDEALAIINDALIVSTFLASERVTVADIAVFSAVLDLVKCDPGLCSRLGAFGRWFSTLLHQDRFLRVIGAPVELLKHSLASHSSSEGDPKVGTHAASTAAECDYQRFGSISPGC